MPQIKIIEHTEYCIICEKKTQSWNGRVDKNKEILLAGFCPEHRWTISESKKERSDEQDK